MRSILFLLEISADIFYQQFNMTSLIASWSFNTFSKQMILHHILVTTIKYEMVCLYLWQAGEYSCIQWVLWKQFLEENKNNLIENKKYYIYNYSDFTGCNKSKWNKGIKPFKIFRIVPFGLFHMDFKLNSLTRVSSIFLQQ